MDLKWIKSAGGPLVVMGTDLVPLWRGSQGNSSLSARSDTDYIRACEVKDYVGAVDVADGFCLVLGDMPLATAIFVNGLGQNIIVRPIYMDPEDDVVSLLSGLTDDDFGKELESAIFYVKSTEMLIFDSAFSGDSLGKECLCFFISPGNYKIMTYECKPSSRISLIVHIFNVLV